jgi:hypothetical protein
MCWDIGNIIGSKEDGLMDRWIEGRGICIKETRANE